MINISIEVVFALPNKYFLFHVKVKEGASIKEAIIKSDILSFCKDIDLSKNKIGIYGRLAKLSDILSDGDRIEIYRPLISNPNEIRYNRIKNLNKNFINPSI